jgi:phage-related protein
MNSLPSYCRVVATEASSPATVKVGQTVIKYGDGYDRVMKTNQINNLETTVEITLAPLTDTQALDLQTFIDTNTVFNWISDVYKPTQWSCESLSLKPVRSLVNVSMSITSRYGTYP